jgi:hypothetical protein
MARGRPPNPLREIAKAAGEKFYADSSGCITCGTNKRYVSNAACVECAINRSKTHYANLDEAGKAERKVEDQKRYWKRIGK